MQEACIEGGFRRAMLANSECTAKDGLVEFTLSRSSYATIVLREIIKPENPMTGGSVMISSVIRALPYRMTNDFQSFSLIPLCD